ncbi:MULTISPECIES: restriction endonuclease subunit S [unclassified Vibrio]|uniref:restriction endonuclease subunit S n=1 Tax=unclassified Vibrio TaxID=2614977 RepID=UPI002964E0EC|nr:MULTISPECIES: restriction endonuclease subunit S [unclassified Vibrio]MDW1583842.1 restriction endonuclease subunit S [Vibrio sp. Vb2897]MDW1642113.1 restriction endonuclease subunit S [Vibrio sp. Vb2896]
MNICRIKDVSLKIKEGGTPDTKNESYWNGSIPWISAPDIDFPKVSMSKKISHDGFKNSSTYLFNAGSVLFTSKGSNIGKVGLCNFPLVTNQNVMGIEPNKKIVPKYLTLVLESGKGEIKDKAKTTTFGSINIEDMAYHQFYLPDLSEQNLVADYAFDKIKVIENGLNLLTQKLRHLEEYKTSLIHNAVTKGLDANGCRILDGTPANEIRWGSFKVKDLIVENEKSNRPASVGELTGKYQFFKSSIKQNSFCDFYDYEKMSIVMGDGGVANASLSEKYFSKSDHCWSFYSNVSDLHTKFLFHFIVSQLKVIDDLGFKGMGIRNLDKNFVRNLEVFLPDEDEVLAINNFIEKNIALIMQLENAINKKIDLLLEYKKSLINEAVSGQ